MEDLIHELLHALLHTLQECLIVLPFLFIAYLAIELLEHYAEEKTTKIVQNAGRFGPAVGALVGVVPQCGFSAIASNLYAGGILSLGTLLAVFMSTSDEMLPILISHQVAPGLILKILGYKVLAAMISGFVIDLLWRRSPRRTEKSIHEMCESEGCHCEDGVLKSALRHTVHIFLFLLLVTFVIQVVVELIGQDTLSGLILNRPVVGQLIAGLIGMIPNCAGSVVITELFLQGGMSAGAMLSGLMVSAGVGVLVLFRMNHRVKENLWILGILYACSVAFGCVAELLPIFS